MAYKPDTELKVTLTQDEMVTLKLMVEQWQPKAGCHYSAEVSKQANLLEKIYKAAKGVAK